MIDEALLRIFQPHAWRMAAGKKKMQAGKKLEPGRKNGRETEKSFSGRSCLFCCDVGEAGWGMVYVTSG